MNDVEKLVPNAYQYRCDRDPGLTGRFEVTVYKTAEDLENQTNGTLLHSKDETKQFPKNHKYEEFTKAI